jgi:low affinity Fe/Cu permease
VHGPDWKARSRTSRGLHRAGELAGHSAAGLTATALVVGWVIVGAMTSFPDWWATVLYSTTASITFVMVFVIQHTQGRQQSASHRKLDELLRALPEAANHVMAVEEASDEELAALAGLNLEDRRRADIER